MKKLLIAITTIMMILLAGCSGSILQNKETVYEKYQDNPEFIECFEEGIEEIPEIMESMPEEIQSTLTDEALKEIISNACLTEMAYQDSNETMCQDLMIDKSTNFYEEMHTVLQNQIGIPDDFPRTTEDIIRTCKMEIKEPANEFLPERCMMNVDAIRCLDWILFSSPDGDSAIINFENNLQKSINITNIYLIADNVDKTEIVCSGDQKEESISKVLEPGKNANFYINNTYGNCDFSGIDGKIKFIINLEYYVVDSGPMFTHNSSGTLLTRIEKE